MYILWFFQSECKVTFFVGNLQDIIVDVVQVSVRNATFMIKTSWEKDSCQQTKGKIILLCGLEKKCYPYKLLQRYHSHSLRNKISIKNIHFILQVRKIYVRLW